MAHTSNVYIDKGTFNSAQGDFHIHNGDTEFGLHTLKQGVSLGAIHDSAERYPPANCHPDTRKAVRQIILDWISRDSRDSSFFWLYGPAGAGKTAILQAIAEFLCSESGFDENFGGSFFFSRGKTGGDQGHFLFSTIAYQLAINDVTGLRQHVNRIMESNPTLHTKSMDVQLQTLIIDAFKYLLPRPQHSYLVIIDGLDECSSKATQQAILRLLCETITVHKLPLRFLIGSRPESHIRASFDEESLYTITHRVVLDKTFNPGGDIRLFLRDGFAKICASNSILANVEQPWPREGVIDLLVQRSSGQFIYAATVLKFVGADFCNPTKQLALVLKPDHTAFSDLDHLYTQILSVYPSSVNIVEILGIIIACEINDLPEVIEDMLGMEEGELKLVLHGLSSLMDENRRFSKYVTPPFGYELSSLIDRYWWFSKYVIPPFAHTSFRDYLFDSSRSGPFHVNQQDYENNVTIRSFSLILQSIRTDRTPSTTGTRVLHTTTWKYVTDHLPDRFIRSSKIVKEAIMTDINGLMQEFCQWMTSTNEVKGESFFAMRRLDEILQQCLKKLTNPNPQHDYAQSDLDDGIGVKFKILLNGYRKMWYQSLTKSKDLGDMLKFLPGIVVQKRITMQELYRIEPDSLGHLIKSPIEPLKKAHSGNYILDKDLSSFLKDKERSRLYYCDPTLQHISICRRFLSLLNHNGVYRKFYGPVDTDYACDYLSHHLCAATTDFFNAQNISDDHPAVEFLRDLEATAYYLHKSLLGQKIHLAYYTFQAILIWADMVKCRLKGVTGSVSNVDLMGRVCNLMNKMYGEMLSITTHERMTYITLGPDGLHAVQARAFPWPPQYKIVLCWGLLSWILVEGTRIPCSFTNFITTPKLSGDLYISPDVYHTQITEYLLDLYHLVIPNPSLWEHFSRALPTEMIFDQLRTIPSDRLFRNYSAGLILNTLEIIVKWLQGLGSERPSDLYDRFQGELLRYKFEDRDSTRVKVSTVRARGIHAACTPNCQHFYYGFIFKFPSKLRTTSYQFMSFLHNFSGMIINGGNLTSNSLPTQDAASHGAGGTQVSDSHQGRLLVVKKFEGPRASANLKQDRMVDVAFSSSKEFLHPIVLKIVISEKIHFVLFCRITSEQTMQSLIAKALRTNLDMSVQISMKVVKGIAAGLSYIKSQNIPMYPGTMKNIQSSEGPNFGVLTGYDDEPNISFYTSTVHERDSISQTSYDKIDGRGVDILFGLCQQLFSGANSILYGDSPERVFDVYDYSEGFPRALPDDSEGTSSVSESENSNLSNPSNSSENSKSSRTARREVWWFDSELGVKRRSLESINRRFEDSLDHFLSSSSDSLLLRHITSPMDRRLRHNLHQCPGYLREEIMISSDMSKSVVISYAFPRQGEICSICGQIVQYKIQEQTTNDRSEQHAQLPRLRELLTKPLTFFLLFSFFFVINVLYI